MSFLLDIVIPKDEMNKVGLEEELIEWGGVKFSQEPPKYIVNKKLVFEELADLKYHCGLLGNNLNAKKFCALIFKGEELSELEFLVNCRTEDLRNNQLYVFLESLIALSSFYIFLLREDEDIKEQYVIEREEELMAVLCEGLSWDTTKDILIFKQ